MRYPIKLGASLAASAFALSAGSGSAQTVDSALQAAQSNFSRSGNVSVLERPHPEYDAIGVRVGSFTAMPQLQVGLEGNDNIYATDTDRRSDAIATVAPQVQLSSNWSRNQLQLFARSISREYLRYGTESTTDYQLGGSGRLDIASFHLDGGGDYGRFTEPRTAPDTARGATRPVTYAQADLTGGYVQEFNRVRLTARGDFQSLDYTNVQDALGNLIVQDDRNHTVTQVTGRAEYALTPDTALLMNVVFNDHRYDLKPPVVLVNRNSHGETVEAGATFDLSHLVRGEFRVGYLRQDFAAADFHQVSGLSVRGKADWFVTQLTTITLSGERTLRDAAISESPAYLASAVSVEVDHELLRNLILTARAGVETDRYLALSRQDRIANVMASATYMMNRRFGYTLSYAYLDQSSSGSVFGPKFADNRLTLSTKIKF